MRPKWKLSRPVLALFVPLLVAGLACRTLIPRGQDARIALRNEPIGYDFTQRTFEHPEGDNGAPDNVFIHRYPVPGDGSITGLLYLNDADTVPETATLLILRPVTEGWEVVHQVALPEDDHPPAVRGIATLDLDPPLSVQGGDVFAHWQPEARPTGPLALNLDSTAIDGLSIGQAGFQPADIRVGKTIAESGFTGRRDYAINIIFKPGD